jgi:prolyl-tRNA synthetase
MNAPKTAITPTRQENYPEWYQQVIKAADLAENSPVRGCMVIKPWGYALWENIQRALDGMFKATGHKNAYFPLFIPLSYMQREAEHVEGFAKECAVVTHHRLEVGPEGKLIPAGELEEPLIVRPTSETMIGEVFSKWIQSYRDLPLKINQWANVVRWEMRTRLFLRTTEFLWQEGHTVHATEQEARDETMQMLEVYADFARNHAAIPVLTGAKTESEKFPGAVQTLCIEAMMQDRKALQCGTSHFFGQNFAKASNIKFLDETGKQEFGWTTSWGVSTRLIGAIIMTHSDDDGLVLPPMLAPAHVVIMPITFKADDPQAVMNYCEQLAADLRTVQFASRPIEVELDTRDMRGGDKVWQWIKKGVPIRLEVGQRDMAADSVFFARRDRSHKEKAGMPRAQLLGMIANTLEEMQRGLLERAGKYQSEHTKRIDSRDEFHAFFTPKNEEQPEIHGGFALAHYSGEASVEEQIRKDLSVTIRTVPFGDDEPGTCIFTGKPSPRRVVWAKAY